MVIAQTVLVKGVTIISSILLARPLGRDQLGLWTVVPATGGVVWVVAELGLGAALVPLIAEAKADGRRVARLQATSFLLSMVVGGMIITGYVAVTPHLATAVYGVPGALPLFLLVAGTMALNLSPALFVAYLQAKRRIATLSGI